MGYTTDFEGSFQLDKPLTREQFNFLTKFSESRRMKRNPNLIKENKTAEKAGLGLGIDAGYFVDGGGCFGQEREGSIIDFNSPPSGQPSLWCQWIPVDCGKLIEWDGDEKFYEYVEWIEYIIEHFIKAWGRTLNGEVFWQGEDPSDKGKIIINNNKISTKSDIDMA